MGTLSGRFGWDDWSETGKEIDFSISFANLSQLPKHLIELADYASGAFDTFIDEEFKELKANLLLRLQIAEEILKLTFADVVAPHDPNDKNGPAGYGDVGYVSANAPMPYTIDFENVSTATAPAQIVTITDQLSSNLDWRTFQLGQIAFGSQVITVPAGRSFFETTIDLRPDGEDLLVQIDAGIDPTTGIVHWTFASIDPDTGLAPTAAGAGFLPPDDANHDGEGYVTYTVKPLASSPTGTVITNQATVTFDEQPPLETDTTSNVIDSVPPTSAVVPLPATETNADFTVSWSGQDDPGGSGLATYTIYVSIDGAPPSPWLSDTTDTSDTYDGTPGNTYAFFSQATDNVGNVEPMHATADTQTTVPGITRPAAPTNLVISPNTGSTLGFTNTGAITLSGTVAQGVASVDVFDATANTDLGLATLNGTSFSEALNLSAGMHQLQVTAYDSSHNASSPSTFTVDVITTPPAAPTSLAISPNSGTTAGFTNTGAVTLTGSLNESNLSVDVYDATAGVDLGAATVNGTGFSLPLNLAAGTHQLQVTATDLAGNQSPAGSFTMDVITTPPAAPTNLAITPNTGTTPGLTDTGSVTLSGSLSESNLSVDVYDATTSTDLGAATVNGTTFSLPLNLSPGTHQLDVTATDLAGNMSAAGSFTVVVDQTSPTVSSLATVPGPRSTPVATEDVTFSKPINPATLSANDVTLTLNGGSNLITADVTIAFVSGNTYQINGLAALTAAPGTYTLTVNAAGISDLAGNAGLGSLATTWVFNASIPASPTNLAISPDTGASSTDGITDTGSLTLTGSLGAAGLKVDVFDATANTELGDATVTGTTFSLPIQLAAGTHQLLVTATDSSNNSSPPSTFTVDVITTPPAAPTNLAISPNTGTTAGLTDTGAVTLTGALAATNLAVDVFDATANVDLGDATVAGTTFSLAINLAAGTHQLEVTATDLAGNVSSPAPFTVVVDQTPPTATLAAVTSPRNTAVATEDITFSKPVNAATLNDNDLTLTLDGGSNLITSAVSITLVSGNTYQINGLGSLTAADGTYALAVNPSAIADLAGNPGTGTAAVSWVMDTVPPTLSLAPISVPRTTPVATEDITFSKPINPATLNSNDFTLTFNGGPNLITAAVTISPVSGNIYQINGLAPLTATPGTYTLTVNATDISDLAGNAGVGSLSTSWVVSSNAPASPTNLAISPNTGVSPGLTDTGSVTLTGSLAATGLAVDVFDATANVDLGAATVTGTTFSLALSLAAGTHQLRVTATDLAGNVSSPALFTVVVDQTPPTATLAAVTSPRNTAVAT